MPRSAIPRLDRQAVVDRLTGEHLMRVLQHAGVPPDRAVQAVQAEHALRALCGAAAGAQDAAIYARITGKAAYDRQARMAKAEDLFLDPGERTQLHTAP